MANLDFKLGNPGAVQHGNFINYYQFHPPENRIELLPKNIWGNDMEHRDFCALDIGCNAGDLSISLHKFLQEQVTATGHHMLGIDIDPTLIARAQEKSHPNTTFKCLDCTNETTRDSTIQTYLSQFNKIKFDAVFCFSTTMWIHLNNGDEGLQKFLEYISSISEILVIEPQPWKCYRAALKRVKGNEDMFPLFKSLDIRSNVEEAIENILNSKKVKIMESERTKWGRKLLCYKN